MDKATRSQLNRSMAALAGGDRSAFDSVYRTLWPMLARFVAVMSKDRMIAEDIAQQAMLKILGKVATFDTSMDAATWGMAIAANEYRSYRRRLGNRSVSHGEHAEPGAEPFDEETPEAVAIRRDLGIAIRAILRDLRPQDLEVVVAAVYEGQRPPVAAAAFRKRLQRVLAAIRASWKRRYGDDRAG
ncbi:MAG: RNA polymerase sigma factor [Gammaproteobacteria bacterium]|nr:RNA polymerase sigma factor [Gammaproteobacteria bacterium]